MGDGVSRRSFVKALAAGALASSAANAGFGEERFATCGTPAEWSYASGKQYSDPFNQVDVDAIVTLPTGQEERIPAFWAGGSLWRARYSPPAPGLYRIRSVSSDTANHDLHGQAFTLHVEPYAGQNPHYKHGVLQIAEDRRHFQHADGTPFFWLGDTWWMGLCKRISWPDDFEALTADRVRKGFSIIQIVAGLYPDMGPFDDRGANEAGFPWERDYARINPAYFDMADVRIQHLADCGLAACIVGFWGFYIPFMGVTKVKQHWRNIIARWGAYPVVWCLAGEGISPYYLSKAKEQDAETQKLGLTELARYVRATDAHHRPITIHPSTSARVCVDDPSVLDFDMLQTGHEDRKCVANTIETIARSLAATPRMPAVIGEICYEGIMEANREEIERFMFWAALLSGTGGHTYGANGIWQVNTCQKPFGLSYNLTPNDHSWGGPAWDIAMQLPGSRQVGLAKGLFTRYSWWKLQPRPELIEPHWSKSDYWKPFAAQIPKEAVVAFVPVGADPFIPIRLDGLEAASYRAYFFNPGDGTETEIGTIRPDAAGNWKPPQFPSVRDWTIVLENKT